MDKYIIEYQIKMDGSWKKGYHENLTENKNSSTMNVYVEHVTFEKDRAKRFYDEDEAKRFAVLFTNSFQIPKVIPVKK